MGFAGRLVALALVVAVVASTLGGCAGVGVSEPYPPEARREYRGVWVATVGNIDWPSRPGLSVETMRAEMERILDAAAKMNLNAVFFQVRPSCDAVYASSLEPWSEFLSGVQGTAPGGGGYDPLAEWIAASHRRGMELHAWFNPFRARHKDARSALAATHVARVRPDLVRSYDGQLWLDPGSAEARAMSMEVILDVVRRYDIDGVHFDDYFYPYPAKGEAFADGALFDSYRAGGGGLSLGDWRRDNINTFVREVYGRVHEVKPHVRVGISPFGIWRPGFPAGVKGLDAYEALYADSVRWLAAGWVDYLAPQLYWKIDSPQPYAALLDWWVSCSMRSQRRPILVGNFTSRLSAKPDDPKSWSAAEILNQITLTRERRGSGAMGNIHFSAAALVQNRRGIADALAQGPYAEAALPPEMPWIARGARPSTARVDVPAESDESVVVRWESAGGGADAGFRRWVVWTRYGERWTMRVVADGAHVTLARESAAGMLDRVAVSEVDGFGRTGRPGVVRIGRVGTRVDDAAIVEP